VSKNRNQSPPRTRTWMQQKPHSICERRTLAAILFDGTKLDLVRTLGGAIVTQTVLVLGRNYQSHRRTGSLAWGKKPEAKQKKSIYIYFIFEDASEKPGAAVQVWPMSAKSPECQKIAGY